MATEHRKILTVDEIWAAKDIEEREVLVPQWGGVVRIKTFSKRQADEMRKRATVKDRTGKESTDDLMLEALLFVEGVVEPVFTLEDYERLLDKSAVAVSVIMKAILEASGLTDMAVTEADKSNGSDPSIEFAYFLANELKMTYTELQYRMSANEFTYWIAYHRRRQRAQERAQQQAEDRARAQRMARGMHAR